MKESGGKEKNEEEDITIKSIIKFNTNLKYNNYNIICK
jgi:hypothetical protein